jgi:hypothetical protein
MPRVPQKNEAKAYCNLSCYRHCGVATEQRSPVIMARMVLAGPVRSLVGQRPCTKAGKLHNDRRRQHKRIEIRQAHAALIELTAKASGARLR